MPIATAIVCVGLFAEACGSDNSIPAADGGPSLDTGAADQDAGAKDGAPRDAINGDANNGDSGPSLCTSHEAGAPFDAGAEAAALCNSLDPCAAPIVYQRTFIGRPATNPAGGVIADGTYVLTADQRYQHLDGGTSDGDGGVAGTNPRRQLLVIAGATIQAASLFGELTLDTFSGTSSTQATKFTLLTTCPSGGGSTTLDYTATPTTLTLFESLADEVDVTVYGKL